MKKFIIKIVVAVIIAAAFMVGAIFLMSKGLSFMSYAYRGQSTVQTSAVCFSFTVICGILAVECIKIVVKNIKGLIENLTAEERLEKALNKIRKEADADRHIIPTETIKEQKTEKNEPKNTDESDPALVIKDYKFSEILEICKNRENCLGCELANSICPCLICGDKNKYMCSKCKMKEWAINPCIIPTVLKNADGNIILGEQESK